MIRVLLSFIGSLCPAILYNVPRKNLVWAGIAGTLGMLVNDSLQLLTPDAALFSVFLGSVTVAVYSEIMARVRKTPSTIFSIPGIFPLVPGVDAYRTIQMLSEKEYISAVSFGVSTAAKASLIAFGILFVAALFGKLRRRKKTRSIKARIEQSR